VVVVDEFHNREPIAKIKTNKRINLPKIKSKSMMDSRFISIGGSRVGRLLKPK